MEQAAVRDQASWDQVANNFDPLFSRVDDILDTQINLEAQYDMTNKVVEQMMKDQQLLAKQIENTGQAVARLTLDSTRRPFREPDSPTASEASAENPFHRNHQGTSPIIPPLRRRHGGLRSGVEGHRSSNHQFSSCRFHTLMALILRFGNPSVSTISLCMMCLMP